jgi:uncharacterized membrane protein YphA (DoxX/SURF4 family)
MTLVRRLARPLLAASFVAGGLDAFRHPAQRAEAARPLVAQVAEPLGLPADPETYVRANGAAMATAGVLFGLGRLPRLSALVMAVTLAPSAYTQHAFWQEKDPVRRREQRRAFVQDVSLVGAALVSSVDTAGRPGLAWRGRNAVQQAERSAKRATRGARRASRQAKRAATLEARHAVRTATATAKAALPG